MCQNEQDERDRLHGAILRKADDLGSHHYAEVRLRSYLGLDQLRKIDAEMDARIAHRKGYQEMVSDWYTRMDKAGRNTGD